MKNVILMSAFAFCVIGMYSCSSDVDDKVTTEPIDGNDTPIDSVDSDPVIINPIVDSIQEQPTAE